MIISEMVGVPGLEPGTPSLSGTYSNQLSYTPKRKKGMNYSNFNFYIRTSTLALAFLSFLKMK